MPRKIKTSRFLAALFLFIGIAFAFCQPAAGAEQREKSDKAVCSIKEFGILSGFGSGNLREKDDYEIAQVIARLGIDLKAALGEADANPKDLLEFEFEPFISAAASPDKNVEFGAALLIK